MTRLTIYEAWAVDARKLPSGVTECTERKELDSLDFDADQMSFDEALSDAGYTTLAGLDWRGGEVSPGRAEYAVTVDGWVTYLAEVVEIAVTDERRVAA